MLVYRQVHRLTVTDRPPTKSSDVHQRARRRSTSDLPVCMAVQRCGWAGWHDMESRFMTNDDDCVPIDVVHRCHMSTLRTLSVSSS